MFLHIQASAAFDLDGAPPSPANAVVLNEGTLLLASGGAISGPEGATRSLTFSHDAYIAYGKAGSHLRFDRRASETWRPVPGLSLLGGDSRSASPHLSRPATYASLAHAQQSTARGNGYTIWRVLIALLPQVLALLSISLILGLLAIGEWRRAQTV